jgi:RNA polymerase sigma-70 factor, ECF subfamily
VAGRQALVRRIPAQPQSPSRRPEPLLEALKTGDERAFASLVDDYGSSLLRLAMTYVGVRAVAEEVVQETWLGVLIGIDRFEGRSSLKTWIFRILANTASTRGRRERRMVPVSSLVGDRGEGALGPTSWETPEDGLLAGETREVILEAIQRLPPSQRSVVTLRDVEGWPAEEVCSVLELSEGNQRVLLHRGRSKIRMALERYFGAFEETVPAGTWRLAQPESSIQARASLRATRSSTASQLAQRTTTPGASR